MPDNFYTLDPVDQQVALAYAQTLFAEWLKKNPNRAPGCITASGVPEVPEVPSEQRLCGAGPPLS